MKYLRYLKYVLRHKWFVFVNCVRRGLLWRGLVHDNSKLRPCEFFPYANHFYGKTPQKRDATGYYKPTDTGDSDFDTAWLRHANRNDHHWQFWALADDGGGVATMDMPRKAVAEMICDWRGAGRAQGNKTTTREWFNANKDKMQISPATTKRIDIELLWWEVREV